MLHQGVMDKYQISDKFRIGVDRVSIGIPCVKIPKGLYEKNNANKIALQYKLFLRDNYIRLQNYIRVDVLEGDYGAKPRKTKTGYRYPVYVNFDKQQKLICTVDMGVCYGNPYINFEFNPNKLSEEDAEELELFFSLVLFHQYEELYKYGKVSHFELSVDIHDANPSQLVLIDTGKRKTSYYKDTTYQGPRGAELVGTIYNKAQQLQSVDREVTRYEVRINDRTLMFSDLVAGEIKNPHAPFILVTADTLKQVCADFGCPRLANKIIKDGLFGTIKNNPVAKKAIINALRPQAILDKDILWAAQRAMLTEFTPAFMGGGIDDDLIIYEDVLLV